MRRLTIGAMAGFNQAQQMELSGAIREAIAQTGLNPTQEASVRSMIEMQINQLTGQVKSTIEQASQETMTSIAQGKEQINATFASQQSQLAGMASVEIQKIQAETVKLDARVQEVMAQMEKVYGRVTEKITDIQNEISKLDAFREGLTRDLDTKRLSIEELQVGVQSVIGQMSGQWKTDVDRDLMVLKGAASQLQLENQQIGQRMQGIASDNQQIGQQLQGIVANGAESMNVGMGTNAAGRSGKWQQKGLIYEKDLTIPMFPDKMNVENFRNWVRDLGRYVERHVDYPCAELVFKAIKQKLDKPILYPSNTEVGEFFDIAQRDVPSGVGPIKEKWLETHVETDLYELLERALKDKAGDVIKSAGN